MAHPKRPETRVMRVPEDLVPKVKKMIDKYMAPVIAKEKADKKKREKAREINRVRQPQTLTT